MSEELRIEVPASAAGRKALGLIGDALPDVATFALKALFEQALVERDGHPCGPGQTLQGGELLTAEWDYLPRIEPRRLKGCEVLWSGAEALVIDKPSGVSSDPERERAEPRLLAAVLHHLRQGGGEPRRPRLVHRLDKPTSGALLVALSYRAAVELSRQLAEHEVDKTYLALVHGGPREESGVIEEAIDTSRKRKVRLDLEGKPALTRWEVAERFRGYALLRAWPETGRTHQIRVHLTHLGCPLVGDALYGSGEPLLLSKLKAGYRAGKRAERPLIERTALHAAGLRFRQPVSGEPVSVESPLPKDFTVALKQLRKHAPA